MFPYISASVRAQPLGDSDQSGWPDGGANWQSASNRRGNPARGGSSPTRPLNGSEEPRNRCLLESARSMIYRACAGPTPQGFARSKACKTVQKDALEAASGERT